MVMELTNLFSRGSESVQYSPLAYPLKSCRLTGETR